MNSNSSNSKRIPKSEAEARKQNPDAWKELDDLRRRLKTSKKRFNRAQKRYDDSLRAIIGLSPEKIRVHKHNQTRNEKEAAKLSLTSTEYGLLKYAHLKAELSAKPDETLEQTRVRANKIWHEK